MNLNPLQRIKIRTVALIVMLALVVTFSILASFLEYQVHKREVTRHVDAELRFAAEFARHMHDENYHDRIVGEHSIPPEEFDRMVERFNQLCEELDLEYIWSLLLVKGVPVFTSATSPDKVAANQRHAKFFEPHTHPEFYEKAFRTMEIQHQDIIDKWGRIRAVLIPREDARGRKYLFGASKTLSEIDKLTPFIIENALYTTLLFLIPGIAISLLISHWMTRPISELAVAAEEIGAGNYEDTIDIRGAREINIVSQQLDAMRAAVKGHDESLEQAMGELSDVYQVVAKSPIFIYRVKIDADFTTEFISDNYKIMGYDLEMLRSGALKWKSLIPAQQIKEGEEALVRALGAGDDSYVIETALRWASGETHWYKCWNQFIRDDAGHPVAIQGIMTDITDLREARERDARYQDRLKDLARDLIEVEDRERRQLATALHDDLGQMLTALNMKLSVLTETADRDRINDLVAQVDELMGRVMLTCKSLTWEISPPSLYESDIQAGLSRMAGDLNRFFGLDVTVETTGGRIELDRDTSALVFRFAKELLINVAKHAETQHAEIALTTYGDKAHMVVTDEGKGFDTTRLDNGDSKGFGLFSIRERVERMSGSLLVESAPGGGTKVMLIVPFDPTALS